MKLLLVVWLISSASAIPLGEELLEGSGTTLTVLESFGTDDASLEESGLVEEDYEGSGASDAFLGSSGAIETERDAAAEIALSISEDVLVQARSAPRSSKTSTNSDITEITRQTFENNDGNFRYGFSSDDGTSVETFGEQKRIGDSVGTVMRGSYSYVAPDGQEVKITWVADENGFRAFGDAVPTAPPHVAGQLKRIDDVEDTTESVRDGSSGGDENTPDNVEDVSDDSKRDSAEDINAVVGDAGAVFTMGGDLTSDESAPVPEKALITSEVTSILQEIADSEAEFNKLVVSEDGGGEEGETRSAVAVEEFISVDAEAGTAEVPLVDTSAAADEVQSAAEGEDSLAVEQSSSDQGTAASAEAGLGALGILARFS